MRVDRRRGGTGGEGSGGVLGGGRGEAGGTNGGVDEGPSCGVVRTCGGTWGGRGVG